MRNRHGSRTQLNRAAIKELLDKYDISQKRLSDMTGTTESAISRYMSGSRTLIMNNIAKIAWALNVSVDDSISYNHTE